MEKVTLLNDRSLADRFLNERVFNRLFFQFSLVIFVWLLMPTRMIAQALVGSNNIVVFLTIQYYCLSLRHE